jgi:hypothetical protein
MIDKTDVVTGTKHFLQQLKTISNTLSSLGAEGIVK